jgi:SAM-dependent methyltransferase
MLKNFNPFGTQNWLIKRILDDEVKRLISTHARGVLLDIGCGLKPYEEFARCYVDSYLGVDHESSLHSLSRVDIVSDAYDIPLSDSSIDCILCTEVLEHLEEPGDALKSANRVLRPGGVALYTVPFSWPIHEAPRDFYRYSEFGLKYLFEKAGFRIVEIQALDGLLVKLIQPMCYSLWKLRRGGFVNPLWWLIPPITAAMQATAYYSNRHRWRGRNSANTDHYSVVAIKEDA